MFSVIALPFIYRYGKKVNLWPTISDKCYLITSVIIQYIFI